MDLIDACDALALVGGDSAGFRHVLATVLASQGGADRHGWFLARLAASPDGQRVLADQGWETDEPPPWERIPEPIRHRIGGHLASPWWASASPTMQQWWSTTIRRDLSDDRVVWTDLPPFPTTDPRYAVALPHPAVMIGAVANPAWRDLPVTHRRNRLREAVHQSTSGPQAYPYAAPWFVLHLIATSATDEAVADVAAVLPPEDTWAAVFVSEQRP
ncbi:hypothetical protein [Chloroflexus sp.]|uniref:hypothetical protein n=1 Tax=Chloroflexus sp. TaxID=1904827 RepID=UPI00404B239F